MCRLFGFRSVIQSQVHRSLMDADNALGVQSDRHPDGWGVAFYVDGAPHITRSPSTAIHDQLFHRVSGVVASETVLAHVRKATKGEVSVLNCHPFQHGRWTMAHNGDIPSFDAHREKLRAEIPPRLRRYILGDTDSEVVFFLFLGHLATYGPLTSRLSIDDVCHALRKTIQQVRVLCDSPSDSEKQAALLTLIITDGTTMVGVQGGKELYWSSYKKRCGDRATCPHLSDACEAPTKTGFVNHLVFSSEPIDGENVWTPMLAGEIIGVDSHMRLHTSALSLDHTSLSVIS